MSARGSIFGADHCPACARVMTPDVILFCSKCWWALPANERASLRSMHMQRLNTDSKVAKCVRILKGRTPTQAIVPKLLVVS